MDRGGILSRASSIVLCFATPGFVDARRRQRARRRGCAHVHAVTGNFSCDVTWWHMQGFIQETIVLCSLFASWWDIVLYDGYLRF